MGNAIEEFKAALKETVFHRFLLATVIFLNGLLCLAQLQQNASGIYEYRLKLPERAELVNAGLEVADDLSCSGKFVHLVKDYAPVEISYVGKVDGDNYMLTNFKTKGGISDVAVPLEQLPRKALKRWIPIIEEKLKSLHLSPAESQK